ncbi:inositol polyphosphate multikinase [Aplochiton taeniatus]
MSTQHQNIMDSSLSLGRLEINSSIGSRGSRLPGAQVKDKSVPPQVGSQPAAHLNGCVPLSHQVAGHRYGVDKVGILQHPDGTVLKQLQPPPRGPRELQFYSTVYAGDCCDPCLLELQNYLPKYLGTWSSPEKPNDLYLKLEDVTRRFRKPCIMDVKIGQQSYDPFASKEKREQETRKYPLLEEIGFLVLGMRVYKQESNGYVTHDSHYGRGLNKETVKDGLSKFFHNGCCLRKDVVLASMLKIQRILRWFSSQRQFTFYASSLLFVYEGLPSSSSPSPCSPLSDKNTTTAMMSSAANGEEGEGLRQEGVRREQERVLEFNNNIRVTDCGLEARYANHRKGGCARGHHHGNGEALTATTTAALEEGEDNVAWKTCPPQPNGNGTEAEVKMIDFAHVFPSDSQDQGYVYGLKRLLLVLEQVLHAE